MPNANEYLVFEADQVLTNDHLNQQFTYLDQQERWTRNKLIGIGIACGLDLVQQPGMIEVTKGVGLTSQGYLIKFDAVQQYTYYLPYPGVNKPKDKDFPFDFTGPLPFYKEFCEDRTVYQLLTDAGYEGLEREEKSNAQPLSPARRPFLDDFVAVLFLELNEKDLKNCDAFDCNNKGEKMTLQVRVLLVKKGELPVPKKAVGTKKKGPALPEPEAALKRFNVPYADLRNADDLVNAFTRLVDDATLASVAKAYAYCYETFKALHNEFADPFKTLYNDLRAYRDDVLKNAPFYIQYVYDFVDDLIKAYHEFRAAISGLLSECCPDENRFPLHLVLGEATAATRKFERDGYRQYFIYSPLFTKGASAIPEPLFLFRRMKILVKEFALQAADAKKQPDIKITPSVYEYAPLSQRAIPYYYVPDAAGNELYRYWNYGKTVQGKASRNLGYHADAYSTNPTAVQPLLYDIELFNFFRIEGHIGLHYEAVLKDLLQQRLHYNLPFDVIAIAADRLPLADTDQLPECNSEDLETAYKLIVSEFACKVVTPFCYLAQVPLVSLAKGNSFGATKEETGKDDEETNQKVYGFFKQTGMESKSSQYLYYLPPAYQKGDFMKAHCTPKEGTVGAAYLSILKEKGSYSNPLPVDAKNNVLALYYYLMFEYIDAVETVMQHLMTATAATLDTTAFKKAYTRFVQTAAALAYQTGVWFDALTANVKERPYLYTVDVWVDLLIESLTLAAGSCLDERLQTLREEYNRRLRQYALQRSFYHYYSKHPGLEHKAGVPKGGTFVMVYHKARSAAAPSTAKLANRAANATEKAAAETPAGTYAGFDANIYTALLNFVDECKDAPPDKKDFILNVLVNLQPAPAPKFQLPDGAVIADFYVPYLCCSDCPPVAYVMQPPETATFDIQPRTFLFDDEHNYPFAAQPPVTTAGTVQNPFPPNADLKYGDGLKLLTDEKNVLYLHPAMELEKTLQTTVAYKGTSVPITIIVPDASFTLTITADATGAPIIEPAAKFDDVAVYEWFVNDKETIFESKPHPAARSLRDLIAETEANEFVIELNVTYEVNKRVSSDDKKAKLTPDLIKEKMGKGAFEPSYEKETE